MKHSPRRAVVNGLVIVFVCLAVAAGTYFWLTASGPEARARLLVGSAMIAMIAGIGVAFLLELFFTDSPLLPRLLSRAKRG